MGGRREREELERQEAEEERVMMEVLDSAEGALEAQEALGKALASGWMDLASVRYASGVHMLEHFKECAVSGKRLSGTPELRLFWDQGAQSWSLRAPPSSPPPTTPHTSHTSTSPSAASSEPLGTSTEPPNVSAASPAEPPPEPLSRGSPSPGAAEAQGTVTGAGVGKLRSVGQERGLFYGPPALRSAALKFHGALAEVAALLTARTPLLAACQDPKGRQGEASGDNA